MSRDSSKLRFKDLGRIAGAAAVTGIVALTPAVGGAQTGSLQVIAGQVNWFVNNNVTFSTTSSNWGFSEASFTGPASVGASTKNDAFDGAMSWMVGVPTPGTIDSSVGYRSLGAPLTIDSVSVPGAQIVDANPQTISGLTVTGQMFFLNAKPVERSMLVLTNPTGAPITVNLLNFNNLGSDSNTTIFNSSSGDNVVDGTDNWATSYQAPSGGNSSDPVITMAWNSAGAAVPGVMQNYVTGDDRPQYSLTVTVPAGATRRVLEFVELTPVDNQTPNNPDWVAKVGPATNADAGIFSSVTSMDSAGYFAGLTTQEKGEVVNFAVPVLVPTLSPWAMTGLFGALGLTSLGLIELMRRRRFSFQFPRKR